MSHFSQASVTDFSSNGWGASALDALSTALLMDLPDIVNQIVDYVPDIDWSVSANDQPVSLFETTIRYVAGLLSGYDLLKGPLSDLVDDVSSFRPPTVKKQLTPCRRAKWTLCSSRLPTSPTT